IFQTNDSSITSKRCVSKLYYPDEPDFYEPFVPKYVRRNPLINRGYWLRMHAVEQAVLQFLKQNTAKSKIIVNLGCGYDPLPFQFWHRHDLLCKDAVFVDVDYPQLIGKKRDRMLLHDVLRNALLRTNLRPSEFPVFVRSDQYMALGCDLRNLNHLETLLKAEIDLANSSILFVAEVSLTYMPVTDSDSLLAWASTLEDARFCLLEQYLPQGPDHPFAQTMLRHFDKLQTPIHAVKLYPTLPQQSSRFGDAGWPTVEIARSLWDLWSDDSFTPPAVRRMLDVVEPFDEWEEFALFAGHYFMVVASNTDCKTPMKTVQIDQSNNSMEGIDGTKGRPMKTSLAIAQYATAPSQMSLRRFGAAFTVGNEAVVCHGGQGLPSRLGSMDTLVRENPASMSMIQPCNSTMPPARMCHTVTPFNGHAALLVGGRASPACALADTWLFELGAWKQVDDLSPARFRHSAVKVNICLNGTDTVGVLVFGGKTSNGTVLDEWKLWTPVSGWTIVSADSKERPSARYGSAMSIFGLAQDSGFLLGGLDPSGVVLEDIWEWRIAAPSMQLEFKDRTNDVLRATHDLPYSRLGASLIPFGDILLLIGGVSKHKIGGFHEDFVVVAPDAKEGKISVYQPDIALPASAWPLLVGASAVAVSADELVVVGGGAVCFSMGSFWNQGYLTITANPAEGQQPWVIPTKLPYTRNTTTKAEGPVPPDNVKSKHTRKASKVAGPKPRAIPRVQLNSPEDFIALLHTSKPAIIEGQEIGSCQTLWTLPYLKDKVGVDREIIIHECETDRMTFKDKNFQYTKKPFGEFIDGVAAGSKTYLRAISSTQANKLPTKLEEDFPTIAPDFHLGPAFAYVQENLHSSPLRISGPVALWLHYDVLANILVQITGSKTLLLYPPSDVAHLSYPPGGSSSNIDVHSPSSSAALRNTHPHSAFLRPGDILFIPPMWSHTAKPDTSFSVAVNVFFRNLEQGYAAGKDVYGNRDLQAYENGRRDVDKIMRAFKGLPRDMAKFYIERLAGELLER
ncbi:LCM-domain-containing protein, partial [Periconia macrospinosa]